MAIPQKKSRSITVDGLDFRWHLSINRNAPFYRIATIAIELAASPGARLVVFPIGVDFNYVDYDRDEPFTPKVVELFIRSAVEAGWEPKASTGTFFWGRGDCHADALTSKPAT